MSTPAQAEMKLDGQLVSLPTSIVEDPKAVETPPLRARLRQRYDEFTNRCGRSWARRDNVKSAGRSETLWSPRHGAHKVAIGVRVTVGVAEVGCPGSGVIESHFTPESDRVDAFERTVGGSRLLAKRDASCRPCIPDAGDSLFDAKSCAWCIHQRTLTISVNDERSVPVAPARITANKD